ncbi:MAG TPA: molybdenum cofactor guanylyltransferase [Gemmataceae bacterium]|jgi:molybdopterin-guanine dinucleotide biosynthesis protein A|nr:molybdenum cofactor guanylyltransferase [Gemmataceae bacterium]
MRTGGIVLCGGQSKRMGQTKASLPFGDQTLLTRVVERISEAVSAVIVVAAVEQECGSLPKTAKLVHDDEPGRGPLAGLAAGLAALADNCEAAYVSSCDSPFVSPSVIRRLFELLGTDAICVPYVDGRLHPLAAVYRVDVLPLVRSHLALSRLRLTDLVKEAPTRLVGEIELRDIDPEFESLRNVNTPAEYRQALKDAGFA